MIFGFLQGITLRLEPRKSCKPGKNYIEKEIRKSIGSLPFRGAGRFGREVIENSRDTLDATDFLVHFGDYV